MLSVGIQDSGNPQYLRAVRSCKRLLTMLVARSHRISSCKLSSSRPDFWSSWSLPAPNLRKLTVNGQGAEDILIFGGQLPQLESLASAYHPPPLLGKYAALRQVNLRRHGQHNITLELLLNALRGCKALEKLTLHGYSCLDNGIPGLPAVFLPHLFRLELFSSDSALILEHLEAPSLMGPVVIFDSNPGGDILRSIPRTQHVAPYLQDITKLCITLNSHSMQFYIAGHRAHDKYIALYIGVHGVPELFRREWVRASIQAIASSVHFSNVRNLIFSTDALRLPWDLWLPNLGNVRELTFSCPEPEVLVNLLGTCPENGLPLCPSLQTLALHRCGEYAGVDHTSLRRFINSRYQADFPLRKLKLRRTEWDRVRKLDEPWVALARSQCAYLIRETHKTYQCPTSDRRR